MATKQSKTALKIIEADDFGCYLVESSTKPDQPYYVDLTQRNGHGECNCIFFHSIAKPNLERHGSFIPYNKDEQGNIRQGVSECKHIATARNHFHQHVTQPMLAAHKGE